MFLRNGKKRILTDVNINLCEHGILGSFIECLYVQMLLCPFEEQLNLSSFPVQLGNTQCIKLEVIGEERVNCICAEVFIHNKSKKIEILLGGEWSCQFDCFIREKSCRLIYLNTIKNLVKHFFFCSSYKKGIMKMKMPKQRVKLDISFVHKIVRVGIYRYLIHNFGIENCSFSQKDKCRDLTPKIHQGMLLDCSSLMMKLSPWTKLLIQFYSATVKGIDHFIQVKSKFMFLILFFCFPYQYLCKVLINTSILLFIRFGQFGFGHYLDTRTVKVRKTKVKCSLYVSQPLPVCELSKTHCHKLDTASELDGVPVSLITVDVLLKFMCVNKKHNLCKYYFSFVPSSQNWLFTPSCKTMIPNRKIL